MLLLGPTPYTPDLDDAATTSDIGVYVATHLLAGRSLFAILDDRFVQERRDDHPFLLDELARDFSVMQVALATRESVPSPDDRDRDRSTRLHAAESGRRERRAA
jgi:hypothetical protein